MDEMSIDILNIIREEDVKFIRMSYCDLYGRPKNMAIMSRQMKKAMAEGILFDASAVAGFTGVTRSDLFLVPDCSTISILPWRPAHERVMRIACDIKNPDGTEFEPYSRTILKRAMDRAAAMGYIINIGTECEFTLFKLDESGEPTLTPIDRGGYNDIAPLDGGEDIRRQICLALEDMGLEPEASHHECGRGQNEVDFHYADALTAADNFQTFKMAVKAISQINGAYASFMPKPIKGESGNGLHINLSLHQGGRNVFRADGEHSKVGESFIAGILKRVPEITAFLNPIPNSYERFGAFKAPKFVTWSHQNRSQLIRIPATRPDRVRAELRSADPSCNPYIAFALLIHAGLDGIENAEKLCDEYDGNAYEISDPSVRRLPCDLGEAIEEAKKSEFVKKYLPEHVMEVYIPAKEEEWNAYRSAEDPHAFEIERYFDVL